MKKREKRQWRRLLWLIFGFAALVHGLAFWFWGAALKVFPITLFDAEMASYAFSGWPLEYLPPASFYWLWNVSLVIIFVGIIVETVCRVKKNMIENPEQTALLIGMIIGLFLAPVFDPALFGISALIVWVSFESQPQFFFNLSFGFVAVFALELLFGLVFAAIILALFLSLFGLFHSRIWQKLRDWVNGR